MEITTLLNTEATKTTATSRKSRCRSNKALKTTGRHAISRQLEINFPPCNEDCQELRKAYNDFSIRPGGKSPNLGDIEKFPSSVPYSSQPFLEKTGRKTLEIFSYTFIPREGANVQTVMWDYTIGLVRITPFFRSLNKRKSDPRNSINANPGLLDLTHNITGGQIAAQGYWLPFEAAKYIAATFCHEIRWALVPIFGMDFPRICKPSGTTTAYQIDPAIIQREAERAQIRATRSSPNLTSSSTEEVSLSHSPHLQKKRMLSPDSLNGRENPDDKTEYLTTIPMTPTSTSNEASGSPFYEYSKRQATSSVSSWTPSLMTPEASPPAYNTEPRKLDYVSFTKTDESRYSKLTERERDAVLALMQLNSGVPGQKRKATEMA